MHKVDPLHETPSETLRQIARAALAAGQTGQAREAIWIGQLHHPSPEVRFDVRLSAAYVALKEGRIEQARTLLSRPCSEPL